MKIYQSKLNNKIQKVIFNGFKEHDINTLGIIGIEEPICFYLQDNEKNIISVITCQLFWGALHIKHVFTRKDKRGNSYASYLMEEVLKFAKQNQCPFVYVETLNYQALGFYEKFGFVVDFKREGFSHGCSFYYMKKIMVSDTDR